MNAGMNTLITWGAVVEWLWLWAVIKKNCGLDPDPAGRLFGLSIQSGGLCQGKIQNVQSYLLFGLFTKS